MSLDRLDQATMVGRGRLDLRGLAGRRGQGDAPLLAPRGRAVDRDGPDYPSCPERPPRHCGSRRAKTSREAGTSTRVRVTSASQI